MIEGKEIPPKQIYNSDNSNQLDGVNPEKDIRMRISLLVQTVTKFHGEYLKTRKTVKEQLGEVLDLGLHKYKMDPAHLRDLIKEIFDEHSADPSWIRKLLPKELKDSSKVRLDYKQKHEQQKKQDSQDLRLQNEENATQVQFESNHKEAEPSKIITETTPSIVPSESMMRSLEEELREANDQIKDLLDQVGKLAEPFITRTYLQIKIIRYPLIVKINPLKKEIVSIQANIDLFSKMKKEAN